MKIYMTFPSFSMQLCSNEDKFLSELVLWSASLDFMKYLDYRKHIVLKSHTLFILHNEDDVESNTKRVVIAPISS